MKNITLTLDRKQHKFHFSMKKRSMLAIKENGKFLMKQGQNY